jgi:hypothetical protein
VNEYVVEPYVLPALCAEVVERIYNAGEAAHHVGLFFHLRGQRFRQPLAFFIFQSQFRFIG